MLFNADSIHLQGRKKRLRKGPALTKALLCVHQKNHSCACPNISGLLLQRASHYSSRTSRSLFPLTLPLFLPSDVAGYPGLYANPDFSRQWFNSSTIIARYKVPAMLLTGTRQFGGGNPNISIGVKLNIAPWVKNSGFFSDPEDPFALVQELLTYMIPEDIDSARFNYFYNDVFLNQLPPADWTYEWQNYLTTNDATEVTIALERLVSAVMYSPEYQTF